MDSDLTLPNPPTLDAIAKFARSFNGYHHFGSFGDCAKAARAKTRSNLTEIRNELFFAYRASNHTGDPQVLVSAYEELLPCFEKYLREKE